MSQGELTPRCKVTPVASPSLAKKRASTPSKDGSTPVVEPHNRGLRTQKPTCHPHKPNLIVYRRYHRPENKFVPGEIQEQHHTHRNAHQHELGVLWGVLKQSMFNGMFFPFTADAPAPAALPPDAYPSRQESPESSAIRDFRRTTRCGKGFWG